MSFIFFKRLVFFGVVVVNLYADKNWIPIEPLENFKSQQEKAKLDMNSSQRDSMNKMIQNIMIVEQLIERTQKQEKLISEPEKKWYKLTP